MQSDKLGNGFKVWGVDNLVYGPVELPTLVSWVKERRVTPDTWIFNEKLDAWQRASQVPELAMFYSEESAAEPVSESSSEQEALTLAKNARALRRIKVFANFSDQELAKFVSMMEVLQVEMWTEVVKHNQPGDGMYFVLEGELRVRMFVAGAETSLATLAPGDFFGEASLFDQGPRSADVIANQSCVLLKVSTDSFNRLVQEAPELAAPFLLAMGRTLTARIRADNKRHRNTIVVRSMGARPPTPLPKR